MQLLDFQDPAADSTAQLRLGHVFEYELGFKDATQIPEARRVQMIYSESFREPLVIFVVLLVGGLLASYVLFKVLKSSAAIRNEKVQIGGGLVR